LTVLKIVFLIYDIQTEPIVELNWKFLTIGIGFLGEPDAPAKSEVG
jgi:hypothetical protein